MLCLVLSTGLFAPAIAGPPHPHFSTVPAGVTLVGERDGVPDPRGTAVFVIRRNTEPYPGGMVVLDFSNCSDVRLSGLANPGVTVDCAARTARAISDANGEVRFAIVGSDAGNAPRSLIGCLSVYADGVPFGSPITSTFDLDGRNGLDALDLSVAFGDMNSGEYRPRSDYDADNDVDPLDLSVLAAAMFAGGSVTSGTACTP